MFFFLTFFMFIFSTSFAQIAKIYSSSKCPLFIYIYKLVFFFQSNFRFTAVPIESSPDTCTTSLITNSPHLSVTFLTISDNHPEFIAYIKLHSWCWTSICTSVWTIVWCPVSIITVSLQYPAEQSHCPKNPFSIHLHQSQVIFYLFP